jgi:hypothetical protein
MAITWRSMQAPELADTSRSMELAQKGFGSAFDGLSEVLKQRQVTQDANYAQGKVNNTEAFMQNLYKANTNDEFQAAKAAGQYEQQLSGYGAQVDRAAVRAALDGRGDFLKNRDMNQITYGNAMRDNKEAPEMDAIKTMIARGDTKGATALLDAGTFRNEAPLYEAGRTMEQKVIGEGRNTTDFDSRQRTQANTESRWGTQALQDRASLQSTNLSNQKAQQEISIKREEQAGNGFGKQLIRDVAKSGDMFRSGVAALAREQNIPTDKAGKPILAGLSNDQQVKFQDSVKALPQPLSTSAAMTQYTQYQDTHGGSMEQNVRNRAAFSASLSNGGELSAPDAATVTARGDNIIASRKATGLNNMFAGDPASKSADIATAMKAVTAKGDGERFTNRALKATVDKWINGGFPTGEFVNGKEVTMALPPRLITQILSSTKEEDTIIWNESLTNAAPLIREFLARPASVKLQQEADAYNLDPSGNVEKANILAAARDRAGFLYSPSGLIDEIDYATKASAKQRESSIADRASKVKAEAVAALKAEESKKTFAQSVFGAPGPNEMPMDNKGFTNLGTLVDQRIKKKAVNQ